MAPKRKTALGKMTRDARRLRLLRARETPVQRAVRLIKEQQLKAEQRKNETQEQYQARILYDRELKRRLYQKKKYLKRRANVIDNTLTVKVENGDVKVYKKKNKSEEKQVESKMNLISVRKDIFISESKDNVISESDGYLIQNVHKGKLKSGEKQVESKIYLRPKRKDMSESKNNLISESECNLIIDNTLTVKVENCDVKVYKKKTKSEEKQVKSKINLISVRKDIFISESKDNVISESEGYLIQNVHKGKFKSREKQVESKIYLRPKRKDKSESKNNLISESECNLIPKVYT